MSANMDIARRLIFESSDASRRSVEMAETLNIQDHLTCWHFSAVGDDQVDQFHSALKSLDQRLLAGAAIEKLHLSIELLDHRLPDNDWLKDRIVRVAEIADHLGILIEGWSYEPKEHAGKGIPQVFISDEECGS